MVFGAGNNCQKLFDSVRNVPAVMIADNDLKKHGTVVNSVPVRYAKDIVDWQKYFVLVTYAETDEIENQLCGLGLKKEEEYILMREYVFEET